MSLQRLTQEHQPYSWHSTSSNSNTPSGITYRDKQQVTYPPSFLPFAFYSDLAPIISKWSMPHTRAPRWDLVSTAHEAYCVKNPGYGQAHLFEAFLCMGWCFYFNSVLLGPSPSLAPPISLCSWGQSFHPGPGPAHVWAKTVLRKSHLLLPLITQTLLVPSPEAQGWGRVLAAVRGDQVPVTPTQAEQPSPGPPALEEQPEALC